MANLSKWVIGYSGELHNGEDRSLWLTSSTPNQAPTASFTYSKNNLAVSTNASASSDSDGTISSYSWNFGDGATASGVTASHTYAAAGSFTISLTVTDDGGATGAMSQSVSVTAGTIPSGGTYDTGLPRQVFAANSFWYKPLPNSTPVVSNSSAMINYMIAEGIAHFGSGSYPSWTINTSAYSPPIWVAGNSDPLKNISYSGSGTNSAFEAAMSGVRIPSNAVPANGSDSEVVFYNPDIDDYCELWLAAKDGSGNWSAQWGARALNASQNSGVGVPSASGSGVTAAGLFLDGGTIKAQEFQEGHISHVCGIALTINLVNPTISSPATRTDGQSQLANTFSEGQRLRLPASLNLDNYNFNPATRTFARMVQEYGLIVWDRAGALSFRAENPLGLVGDPYARPNGVFGDAYNYNVLWGAGGFDPFPWSQLQVLPINYMVP